MFCARYIHNLHLNGMYSQIDSMTGFVGDMGTADYIRDFSKSPLAAFACVPGEVAVSVPVVEVAVPDAFVVQDSVPLPDMFVVRNLVVVPDALVQPDPTTTM